MLCSWSSHAGGLYLVRGGVTRRQQDWISLWEEPRHNAAPSAAAAGPAGEPAMSRWGTLSGHPRGVSIQAAAAASFGGDDGAGGWSASRRKEEPCFGFWAVLCWAEAQYVEETSSFVLFTVGCERTDLMRVTAESHQWA